MRDADIERPNLLSYVSLESRIPAQHPPRPTRELTDRVLAEVSAQLDAAYAETERRWIPPEKLTPAPLLQALYSIRSKRALMENRMGASSTRA